MKKGGLLVIATSGLGKTFCTDKHRKDTDIKVIDFNYRPWMFLKSEKMKQDFINFYRSIMSDDSVILLKNINSVIEDYIIDPERTVLVCPKKEAKEQIIKNLKDSNQLERKINDVDRLFDSRRKQMEELSKKYGIEIIELNNGQYISDIFNKLIEKLLGVKNG